MSEHAFPSPPIVALPIAGSSKTFPVRRIYCVGRNYGAHAIEMGHNPDREAPFFFQKNAENLNVTGNFPYPEKTSDVHHEVEMAVMLKSGGTNIQVASALDHVFGYALCLDMTRRDLQAEQKKAGRPWEIAKAFEHSAPVGAIHPVESVGHMSQGRIELKVNGDIRQEGDINQMIWSVPEVIACLSTYYELGAGDVILSGTPSGVGAVERGDEMIASLNGFETLTVRVV